MYIPSLLLESTISGLQCILRTGWNIQPRELNTHWILGPSILELAVSQPWNHSNKCLHVICVWCKYFYLYMCVHVSLCVCVCMCTQSISSVHPETRTNAEFVTRRGFREKEVKGWIFISFWTRLSNFPASTVTEASPRVPKVHDMDYFTDFRRQMHLIILIHQLSKPMDLGTQFIKLLTICGKEKQ